MSTRVSGDQPDPQRPDGPDSTTPARAAGPVVQGPLVQGAESPEREVVMNPVAGGRRLPTPQPPQAPQQPQPPQQPQARPTPAMAPPPVPPVPPVPPPGGGSGGSGGSGGGSSHGPGSGPSGGSTGTGRHRRTTISLVIAAAAVALVVVIIAAFLLSRGLGGGDAAAPTTTGPSTSAPALGETSLVSNESARSLDEGAQWTTAATTSGTSSDIVPVCTSPTAEGLPTPRLQLQRALSSDSRDRSAALHVARSYASIEDARAALTAFKAQLAACQGEPYWILSAATTDNLGDEAFAMQYALRAKPPVFHTVVVERTGTTVNIVDATRNAKPVDPAAVNAALAPAVNEQCRTSGGACAAKPGKPVLVEPPAVPGAEGFLLPTDLPRINPGSGQWAATGITSKLDGVSSGCDGVDLSTVPADERRRQTYLLRDDAAAAGDSGVDEAVLTFKDAKSAAELRKKITDSIGKCKDRSITDASKAGPKVTGQSKGQAVEGQTFLVDRRVANGQVAHFRVAVTSVGPHVTYLFMPLGEGFNVSDEEWSIIALRSAQRVLQAA